MGPDILTLSTTFYESHEKSSQISECANLVQTHMRLSGTDGLNSIFSFKILKQEGTQMNLLIDPESALSITASAVEREDGKTFMESVHFSSPNGAHLEFDLDGVHLAGLGDTQPTQKHPLTGHQQYGDILFIENW